MNVTAELLEEIRTSLSSLEFGKVTITVDSASLTADVSVERKTRYKIPKSHTDAGEFVTRSATR